MDYSRLRAAALHGSEDEEAVTVDTRALIDKVLARYSGEWTTLRELIQNAADAQATKVMVKFETLPSTRVPLPSNPSRSELLKHTISHHALRRLVVTNDGQPFTKTDWARLKRIAEGNPDETKIGAFGVGFYSVFADCEEPFVSSGSEAMAFYWKGNALFTKKTTLPPNQANSDTAFVLDYRTTTTPVPNILSVAQFLGTSLTFVALQKMEFWIDDWRLLSLHKKVSPSIAVAIPRDLETRTQEGIMTIAAVDRVNTQIDATHMAALGWKRQTTSALDKGQEPISEAPLIKSFFAKFTAVATQSREKAKAQAEEVAAQLAISEDITKVSSDTIFLRVTSANVRTTVTSQFSTELERATKKPPPKIAKLAILSSSYTGKRVTDGSNAAGAQAAADVFATVMPSKKPGGRIFIGFPTMQTTGAGLHISAPSVIPTVEREAIDLNARWVRSWNMEMLRAAGILTRLSYYDDMNDLGLRLRSSIPSNGPVTEKEVAQYLPEALHLLKTYTFSDSTPSSQVGDHINQSFWTAFNSATVEVFSTKGVLPSPKVRLRSPEVAKFINGLPMVPQELEKTPFIEKLVEYGLLTTVTVSDIRQELSNKAMNKDQLATFITWAAKGSIDGKLDKATLQGLLNVAVAMIGEKEDQGEIVALSTIQHFIVTGKIPPTLPIPPDTMPFSLTSHCSARELQALGWTPLEIYPWLQFLISDAARRIDEQNMLKSPVFAAQVLGIVSKSWDSHSQSTKELIIRLLQSHPIMPTKLGMRRPQDSFFASVKLFDDLPVIQGCNNIRDKFLAAIGVRKTLDLETIFARLFSPANVEGKKPWSHVELIRYLASVADDIPRADMKKFYEARMCPAEAGPKGQESSQASSTLYRVADLFEPQDSLRELGLPILQWPTPSGVVGLRSAELHFLESLGLRKYPTPMQLVEMMAGPDIDARQKALSYFLTKYKQNGYQDFDLSVSTKPFLPVEGQKSLVCPSQCYSDEAAAVLGYRILRKDLHADAMRLGVLPSPPINDCVRRLLHQPPRNVEQAKKLFSYFSRRTHELKDDSLKLLRAAPIVPLTDSKGTTVKHTTPSMCYLGSGSSYADIFDFVDFGEESNTFLYRCGAKTEPTTFELATRACEEPARLLGSLDVEKYLSLLRTLANSASELRRERALWGKMKRASFLLGCRTVAADGMSVDDEDDSGYLKQYQLASAGQITIPDDFIAYRIFQQHLLCAPEDEVLERFYESLGANLLTHLVQEDLKIGSEVRQETQALQYRKHLVERSQIFLHEYSRDKKDNIRHDAKWLNKNLKVVMVQTIALRRKLPNHPRTEVETRSAASQVGREGCILYLSTKGRIDMYHVAQALCKILLRKENLQTCVFFEPFLTLDLIGLRNRGYNVQRILRAKEQEARIAEEERQKALREEQERLKARAAEEVERAVEQDKLGNGVADKGKQAGGVPDKPRPPVMPGTFDNEEFLQNIEEPKRSKGGFFHNLKNRWGLDFKDDEPDSDSSAAGPSALPPPPQPRSPKPEWGKASDPAVLQQNLANAVRSTRAYGSDEVMDKPVVKEVTEQSTYCDRSGGNNVKFLMESSSGMKIFADKDLINEETIKFLSANGGAINVFSALLIDAASIYGLQRKALHIFYNRTGGTIAFNKGGSIFSNLRYFLELHAKKIQASDPVAAAAGKAEALVYWWVVLAHELAHNLVDPHNSEHSYYTESFIQQYHPALVAKMASGLMHASGGSGPVALPASPPRPAPHRAPHPDPRSLPPPPPYTEHNSRPNDPRQSSQWRN